ncbi:MAG TPA: hypothetical protein VGR15_10520 [Bacteroidota bacterium]|jgi:hydroxymethylpyrimidine pyrophosphatase-like HAD family hydrolase|nr:hypothetical protein [Bacteroidota bacterium]
MYVEAIEKKEHATIGERRGPVHPEGGAVAGGDERRRNGDLAGFDTMRNANALWARNLLHAFGELFDHLRQLSERKDTDNERIRVLLLDGLFTVSALWQILEDYLHRGYLGVGASFGVVTNLRSSASRPQDLFPKAFMPFTKYRFVATLVSRLAGMIDNLAAYNVAARVTLRERRLLRAATRLRLTAQRIAALYAAVGTNGDKCSPEILRSFVSCARGILGLRFGERVNRRVMRIPACFKDFDCQPEDCREFAKRFCALTGERNAPVTIVGLRTSGCYLAPLCAAYLLLHGFTNISIESMRQGVHLFSSERLRIRSRAQKGFCIVVDDPPFSGDALKAVVGHLQEIGIPADRIYALIFQEPDAPLFHSDSHRNELVRDEVLSGIRTILLPKKDWHIERVLRSLDRISRTHAAPAPKGDRGIRLGSAEAKPSPATRLQYQRARCHDKLFLDIGSVNSKAGRTNPLVVKGSGLGWYQDHVLETARELAEFVPRVERVQEGLLGTAWIEGHTVKDHPVTHDEEFVRHVARYVARRRERLAVTDAAPGDLEDRKTGWHILAQACARSYSFLRSLAYYNLRRRLSHIGENAPRAVIDGRMGPAEWIVPVSGGYPLKIDFEEHCFDRADLSILDPGFDLAGFSAEHRLTPKLEDAMLQEYVRRSGDADVVRRLPALTMMYCLSKHVELRSQTPERSAARRTLAIELTELERILSNTANQLLASSCGVTDFKDTEGKMFAIDLDGVLEDSILGFSCTTPAGVEAIRTLKIHGYQPVIATGRSLQETMDRCRIFDLQGGVAEYGSILWIAKPGTTITLVRDEEMQQLRRLRQVLSRFDDIIIDPAYRYSVRAFRFANGLREPANAGWLEAMLRRLGLDHLRTIRGNLQTDVVGKSCCKGEGMLRLKNLLHGLEIHAVGDSREDLSLFESSDFCYAPANAEPKLIHDLGKRLSYRSGARTQRGLLQIVRRAAHGHEGACQLCRGGGNRNAAASALVQALQIRDRSRVRKLFDLIHTDSLKSFIVSL